MSSNETQHAQQIENYKRQLQKSKEVRESHANQNGITAHEQLVTSAKHFVTEGKNYLSKDLKTSKSLMGNPALYF